MNLSHYRAAGALRDGTPIIIRAIQPDDDEALREGFRLLSDQTIYQRFFQAKRDLAEHELRYLTQLDFVDHVGLAAVISNPAGEFIIGVGRFVRLGSGRAGVRGVERDRTPAHAEVAFVVGDEFQGQGVGSQLLAHLVVIARDLGIRYLEAEVLPENRPMIAVFRRSGLPITEAVHEGVLHVELRLDGSQEERVGSGVGARVRPAAAAPDGGPGETGPA
ncbi:MAG: GNAT family N-acetyltransferase [Gemmatimonadetes bacterium]|nr:GNAT family N-acetyltransferase [Gemmatimonadota bacterium]